MSNKTETVAARVAAALIRAVPGAQAAVQDESGPDCTIRLTYAIGRYGTALDIRFDRRALPGARDLDRIIRHAQTAAADVNARAATAIAHAAFDPDTRRKAWIRANRAQHVAATLAGGATPPRSAVH